MKKGEMRPESDAAVYDPLNPPKVIGRELIQSLDTLTPTNLVMFII
jgi:hypothetical protein